MDINLLTKDHIVFIPHPQTPDYYCIEALPDNDVEHHFYNYMPMHNCGTVFLPAFALLNDKKVHEQDFIEYLQTEIATGHIKINENPGAYLYRDFYEFKTFEGHEHWIEQYQQHKEAQRRSWLLQDAGDNKLRAVQKTIFD
ncbi:MAG: hypothetical protein JNM14_05330 [Ferruginibacter sp.]|nr:hypothetical protein [Ferruginibacter sp.]